MGPRRGTPTRDPPAPAELLHESERARVTRLFLPGGPLIRKEPLGPDAQRRLRHEVKILERLSGVEGVAQLAAAQPYPLSIMLADVGGPCLTELATPLRVDGVAGLALGLARAVAGMHRRGVVHRDISPANIVVSVDRPCPVVIDFSLATTFA